MLFRSQKANLGLGTAQGNRAAGQYRRLAAKARVNSIGNIRAGKKVAVGAIAAGGSLIALGAHKLIPKKVREEHPNTSKAVSAGSSYAAAFGVRSAYYKSPYMGNLPTWKAVKLAVKRVMVRGTKF